MDIETITDAHAEQLASYERDGYAIFRGAIGTDLVTEASAHVDWLKQRHPDRRGEDLGHDLVASDPFWVRLISDPRLLDIAGLFVGADIALFASHYISKEPFSGKPVLWHQDGAYWPLEPMQVVTLWLAVDHSTSVNGCLRVIPGSHRLELQDIRARDDIDNVLGSESAIEVDESRAVDLELAPGDVEVHHANIVHGSLANESPRRRCGLTIRYIPTSTRIICEQQPFASAFRLRGELGVNMYQPWPTFLPGRDFPFAGSKDWTRADS